MHDIELLRESTALDKRRLPRCGMAGVCSSSQTFAYNHRDLAQDLPFVGIPVANERFEPLTVEYWRHRVLRSVLPNAVACAAVALVTAIFLLWQLLACFYRCCCAKKTKVRSVTHLQTTQLTKGAQCRSRVRPRTALRAAIVVAALGIFASCLYGAITANPHVLQTAATLLDTVQVCQRRLTPVPNKSSCCTRRRLLLV